MQKTVQDYNKNTRFRSSQLEEFFKIVAYKNFTKLIGEHLCQNKCLPANFAKFAEAGNL